MGSGEVGIGAAATRAFFGTYPVNFPDRDFLGLCWWEGDSATGISNAGLHSHTQRDCAPILSQTTFPATTCRDASSPLSTLGRSRPLTRKLRLLCSG